MTKNGPMSRRPSMTSSRSRCRLVSRVLILFSTVSLVASLSNVEINLEYKLDRRESIAINRLSGGTTVSTTSTTNNNKRTKRARGASPPPEPTMLRDYRNPLGLPRQSEGNRPENPEDWLYWTASSDDGCRKRTKKFSKNLNFKRGIAAPPAVWTDPTPTPSKCVEEPATVPTYWLTPSESRPKPSDDAPVPLFPPVAPVPTLSPLPAPWIDPTPSKPAAVDSPTQAPFEAPPTRDTTSPSFAWFDPSSNPASPPANVPSPTSSSPGDPESTDTEQPIDSSGTSAPTNSAIAPSSLSPAVLITSPPNALSSLSPTVAAVPPPNAPGPSSPSVPTASLPNASPTTATAQPASSPENGTSSPAESLQPNTPTSGPLDPTFATPIPTFPQPSSPDAPPPILLPPTIYTSSPTTSKPTPSPVFPRPPAEVSPSAPDNESPTFAPFRNNIPAPDEGVCQAIQNQSIPPELDHSDPTIFGVTMAVQFEFISSEIVQNYLGSMNVPVALWIAGCEDDAMAYVSSERKRRLQEEDREGTVEYSELEPWGVDDSCVPFGEDVTCQTFGTRTNVYFDGNLDAVLLRSRLVEGLGLFSTLVTDQMGVLAMRVTEIELLNDDSGSGIIGGDDDATANREGVDAKVVIGAAAAGLAVFLLTMIGVVFTQRRQSASALSHSRFEEVWEDSDYEEPHQSRAFAPQLISSDSGVYKEDDEDPPYQYQTRVIRLEEDHDDDSATAVHANRSFEVWSPFSSQLDDEPRPFDETEDIFWTNHPRRGPHECSAATCEICELRRQQGFGTMTRQSRRRVHLIPPASSERVPSVDPERWFVSGDTVQL